MTAIGYVRRSKKVEARTVSLEEQRARVEEYASAHGWRLLDTLEDDGVSGGRRQRLERLAERVRTTGARNIIVYNLDRLARDVAGLLDSLRAYARRGVELHVVGRGRIETETASGFLMTGVEGLMAEHYRRTIAEKTRDALARLRLKGRRVSRFPPYGQRFAAGGRLVPDHTEQSVLAEIAAMNAAGLSLRGISRALADRGVVARNGRPFAPATLFKLTSRGRTERVTASAG